MTMLTNSVRKSSPTPEIHATTEDGQTTWWCDSRDSYGNLVAAKPCGSRAEAVAIAATLGTPATNPCCSPDEETWCLDCANSDPATWPEWTNADVWTITPDPEPEPAFEPSEEDRLEAARMFAEADARDLLDRSATLSLVDLLEHQARFFEGWNNGAGALLASTMTRLAGQARLVSATTPDELTVRLDQLEEDHQDAMRAAAYDAGHAAGSACSGGSAWGHSI